MSRPFFDDAERDFEYWDQEISRRLARRPCCEMCGEHIQDEMAFNYHGVWICNKCVKDNTESLDDFDFDY